MKVIFVIFGQFLWIYGFCQTGAVAGRVTSRIHGNCEENPFAQVILSGTKFLAITDFNGRFRIDSIPAGVYEIAASYVQQETIRKKTEIFKDSLVETNFEFSCRYEKSEKDKTCPKCLSSERVIPVCYTMMIVTIDADTSFFWGGTDQTPPCHPHWYCKRDKLQF